MPQAGEIYNPGSIPRRVAFNQAVADLTATSGTTEKVTDTVTASLVNGRTYTIRYVFHYTAATGAAGDGYLMRIRQGTISGAQLTYAMADIVMAAGNVHTRVAEVTFVASATGSQQFTCTVQRASGTGTCTVKGASAQPRELSVRFEE